LDKWYIDGKQGVIDDFRQALTNDYKWSETVVEPPKPPYRVAFVSGGGIKKATTGQVVTTTFKLRNDGSKTWLKGGANPVRIGFHWENGAGQPIVVPSEKDFRTPLPKDVKPGETVTVENVKVAVPDEVGALALRWDLVEEGVTWFKDQGSAEKVETVTVSAGAPPNEIVVPETGKRVRGPFLEWYRRYGLDVAGYPYSDEFVDPATNLPTQVFQRVILEEFQTGSIRLRLAGQDLVLALERLQAAVLEVDRLNEEATTSHNRIRALEEELRKVIEGGGQTPVMRIPAPELIDIVEQLPRDAAGFVQRQIDAIRFLVINHTGGAPDLAIEKIADYHRQRGYPGIAYHYFVDGNGVLFEVNPATDTVSDQGYLGEGLNIAIAGKFNDAEPTDVQLETTAQLCAWLLQELDLPADAIKGVSEFVSTASPGWQWQHGKVYKNRLLEMVAAVEPEPVFGEPTAPGDSAETTRLQAEIARLQAEVISLQAENRRLQAEITPLQAEIDSLRAQLAPLQQQLTEKTAQVAQLQAKVAALQKDVQTRDQRIAQLTAQVTQLTKEVTAQKVEIDRLNEALRQQTPGGVIGVPEPIIHDVVEKLPRHPTLRYSTRKQEKITHICVHHSATPATITIERVAEYHVNPDPSRNKDAWPGIGYHFYIKPDGGIYQTNRLETISYHVYANNDYAVGICVSGDFTRAAPTSEQQKATAHLVAWLMQELKISQDRVLGHKEFPNNDTSCPGVQWLEGHKWKTTLMDAVRTLRSGSAPGVWPKTINHYVLFWQQPTVWAQEDWQAADSYIGRFRPTAGFSIDDARHAEFVTIVGGVAGVSYEVEQMLVAAGCKVDRLAGADFAGTKRLLDELAERGQRFQSLTD
jgi:N-acetyl-anhydromuramyl-L-alanine amidase AmpD/Skp family chaperone for outer membrane proteins